MNVLSLECSQPQASLALYGEEISFAPVSWKTQRNHDADLFPALRAALEALRGQKLNYILVGAGPGSYGGVRVALAAAEGISLAEGVPVVSICSWEPLSVATNCSILSDAKRGGWCLRRPGQDIQVVNTEDVLQRLRCGEDIRSVESRECLEKAGIYLKYVGLVPTAQELISYWLSLSDEQQQVLSQLPAQPLYVRPPHITTPNRKPWEVVL